jgi:hypothetical protein
MTWLGQKGNPILSYSLAKKLFGAIGCNIAAQPGPAIGTLLYNPYPPQAPDFIEEF